MNYKILVVEDYEPTRDSLTKIIKKTFKYETFEAGNGEEALDIAKREIPNLILLDLNIPKINGFKVIELLKEDVTTIDIPIIIISAIENEIIREKLEFNDIKYIMSKPIDRKDLIKKIKDILVSENKFMGSYTNRFIKSFISYYSSQSIAFEMISILEVVSREILISNQKKLDMQASLAMLSTTLKSNKTTKAIQLFEDMRFATDILKLLKGFEEPKSLYEQIIYLIYHLKKIELEGLDLKTLNIDKINEKLLNLIENIVKKRVVIVKSKYSFNLVFNRLIDMLINNLNIDIKVVDEFLSYSKIFLKEIVTQNGESMTQVLERDDSVEFLISDEKFTIDKLKEYIKDIKNPYIKIDADIIDNEKVIIISLEKEVQKLEEKEVSYEQKLLKKSILDNVISANEYLDTLSIDISEDLEDLEELERIWESKVILLETSKDEEHLKESARVVLSYANKINNIFYEFEALGYAFSSLAQIMQEEEIFDTSSIENIATYLENLLRDIRRWREDIFVIKSAENIHFLDNSLLSSCMQIESMLKNEEIGGDDGIEFF